MYKQNYFLLNSASVYFWKKKCNNRNAATRAYTRMSLRESVVVPSDIFNGERYKQFLCVLTIYIV